MSDLSTTDLLRKNRGRKYPGIPDPTMTMEGLFQTVMALKEAVELLTGQRGASLKIVTSGVTWADLIELGLIERDQIPREHDNIQQP